MIVFIVTMMGILVAAHACSASAESSDEEYVQKRATEAASYAERRSRVRAIRATLGALLSA